MKLYPYILFTPVALATQMAGQTLHSHGNPTADEQYMLELINRARANPVAEAQRLLSSTDPYIQLGISYFKVDQARLRREFASYSVQPPLAMNPHLLAAARRHSSDMARNNFQSHTGSDKSSVSDRITAAGYKGGFLGENIYSNLVSSTYFAHAGFVIDWGNGPGGVQQGLGHRVNVMGLGRTGYREVGVGIASRSGADAEKYGKLAVTQNFGTNVASTSFLLGVVYNDKNGDGICDPGEGLPGIKVTPSVGTHYAVTSASGGYSIPFVQTPGQASVTFSGGVLDADVTRSFTMVRENVKVDLRAVPKVTTVALKSVDSLASERGKATGGNASFRIVRSGSTEAELKVTLTRPVTGKKTTALPADYKLSALSPAKLTPPKKDGTFVVTIPKGKASADVRITPKKDKKKDKKKEPTEKAKFTLSKSGSYQIVTPNAMTISIKD